MRINVSPSDPSFVAVVAAIDALIADYPGAAPLLHDVAAHRARTTTYPALTAENVTDDGETFPAVRCPWCDQIVSEGEELIVVDEAERWTRVDGNEYDHDRHTIDPAYDGYGDYETLHYMHEACGNPVDLPEGWTER